MAARIALLLAAWALAAPALAQPPPRDVGRTPPAGTASITGVVVSDERQPKPLRRARVMLNGPQLQVGRTVISNDDGTFAFERLPAGLYTVGAAKQAYVTMNYGARRTGRAGTSVVLGDGESRSLTLRLPRGAVIAGVVTDEQGMPAAGVAVSAMTYRFVGGERRLVPAGLTTSPSDDRGAYRIFGLPAGEYVIIAQVRQTGPQTGALQVLSAEEVRRALAAVRDPSAQLARPGTAPSAASDEPRRTVALAPVFYPGTPVATQAMMLRVGAGEERAAVDFQFHSIATSTVSGTVSSPGDTRTPSVTLTRSGEITIEGYRGARSAAIDGGFRFTGVPPGQYTIIARGGSQTERPSDTPPAATGAQTLWAATDILVDGQDITDIALTLQPGLTISGRVEFEGTKPPPEMTRLRVPLPGMLAGGSIMFPLPPVQFEPGGRFSVTGIIPGKYESGTPSLAVRSPLGGWWLKSIVVNGRDLLDGPLELRQSADDALVTFSNRANELGGRVTDAGGNPVTDRFVVVFGTDKTAWFFNSRRVAGIRPDSQGRYTISNLPPGEYFVGAFEDVEQGEWFDPAVLQRLIADAGRITLGEYEKKKQDIVVGR